MMTLETKKIAFGNMFNGKYNDELMKNKQFSL